MSSGDSTMIIATMMAMALGVGIFYTKRQQKTQEPSVSIPIVKAEVEEKEISNKFNAEKYPGGKISVYFGSQTGTAEGFAQIIVDEGLNHGFYPQLKDLEDFKPDELSAERCAIFFMATYGEGDPTDNAQDFIQWVKGKGDEEIESDQFSTVKYTVFGLGNRQYAHYNEMGRVVDKQLEKYGATRLYKYGEGDDDGTLEEDFEGWKECLWTELRKEFIGAASADDTNASTKTNAPHLNFKCCLISKPTYADTSSVEPDLEKFDDKMIQHSNRHYFRASEAKIVQHRELRQSNDMGSTIHVEFDISKTEMSYVTADNLAILPENNPEAVESVLARMGYHGEQWFELHPADDALGESKVPFPTPCTIRHALTNYVDLNHAPRRNLLQHLAHFASDEQEQDRLLFLSSKQGVEEYHSSIVDKYQTLVDVLKTYSSIRIPLECFMHIVPSLQPRYYTISSSNRVNPSRIHATVSLISETSREGQSFRGACTHYLASLKPLDKPTGKKVRESRPVDQGVKKPRKWPAAKVFVRESSFRLPQDSQRPIIMIGPGTGIAPMRAFLQERQAQMESGLETGQSILYFGCRKRTSDFIYKDELEQYEQAGVLSRLHLAFSREQNEKVYVQHLMENDGSELWDLIQHQNAHLYVCGATSMGKDVHKVLIEIAMKHGNETSESATSYFDQLQIQGRYVQELWS